MPIIEKTILFVPTRHDFQNYLKLSPFTLRKVKLSGLMDTQKSLRSMLLGQHENHGKQKFRRENKCEEQRSDANFTSFFTYLKGWPRFRRFLVCIDNQNYFFVLFMVPNILLSATLKTWTLIHFRYFINVKCTIKHYSGNKIMLHICVWINMKHLLHCLL